MATAANYTAPLESTRAKLLEARRAIAASAPAELRTEVLRTIEWLEEASPFNVVGPALAAVAGTDSQRRAYLELAHGLRSLGTELLDLRDKLLPIVSSHLADIGARFEAAVRQQCNELAHVANVILCLIDARDEHVTDDDARFADRLRFEAAKGVVLTMHDEAFRRLAK